MATFKGKLGRLHHCTFEQVLRLRNRGFEGYYFNMQTTMDRLISSFGTNSIRPELSVVAYVDDAPVGFVFIGVKTIRGQKLAWNGGTGVFPEYRGQGIAKAMMVEANHVLREQEVDRTLLEVVTKNSHAIAAYEKGGFHVVDRLLGMKREGALKHSFYDADVPEGWRFAYGKPVEASRLSFYRENVAWSCMWHNMREGASLILRDTSGHAVAYALFTRHEDEDGQVTSIVLRQCEVSPEQGDRERLFRLLLSKVFGAEELSCSRATGDLSLSNPEVRPLLEQADFETKYEQYLMMTEK